MIRGPNAARLRRLVDDRYRGLMTQESYRQQRAMLLDNLGEGDSDAAPEDVTVTVTPSPQPIASGSASSEAEARPQPPPQPKERETVTSSPPDSPTKKPNVGIIAVGAALVVIGAGAVYFITAGPEAVPPQEQTSNAALQDAGPTTGPGGAAIFEDFLEQNDWSADSLESLAISWGSLDIDQQSVAADSRVFRRFTGRLHQRIREEAALSTSVSPRMQTMMDLATSVGAPYRLSASLVPEDADQPEQASTPTTLPDPKASIGDDSPDAPGPATVTAANDIEPTSADSSAEPTSQEESTVFTTPVVVDEAESGNAVASPASNDPCPENLANSRRPYCQDPLLDGGTGPMMVVLRAGSFQMGSDQNTEELPLHNVEIDYPLSLSRDEVSLAEYRVYCTAAGVSCPDARWGGDDYPVVMVNWDDAKGFTDWLSLQTGYSYRLPTEAEWEYAARAGTQTPYSFGDEITPSAAHSYVNGGAGAPLPRSSRAINRNAFRLYHMSGNVREWTADDWHANYDGAPGDGSARSIGERPMRVVRGGSYEDPEELLRSAARVGVDASHRDEWTGFRVVRDIKMDQN